MSHDHLLCARTLCVGFGRTAILPPIDLAIRRGELWGLVGRNGAGKTTLLRTLLGLHAPVSGHVERAAGVKVGHVPQRHVVDPLMPSRARDMIAEGADRGWSFLRPLRSREARTRIARAIEATRTEPLLARRYRDLSEGEKQRVLLARAVAGAPDLLVLDEPTSAMDLIAERQVAELLQALRERFAMGIVLVSHHLSLVARIADRLAFVDSDEHVACAGAVDQVLAHPAFTRRYCTMVSEPSLSEAGLTTSPTEAG
ncbi:Zinc ABC transporter, ATP-binding protein ZnuC [Minicystis rosea]|nr:Zinc ABC transporter, ATP-binding protein ZnuC [Minicystis rosea]